MNFLGIDNGVSGTIACLGDTNFFVQTPVKEDLAPTKEIGHIRRIAFQDLLDLVPDSVDFCLMERPMTGHYKAAISAAKAFEVTILVLEIKKIRYEVIDSKEWQSVLLPRGVKGSSELKQVSKLVGIKLFPKYTPLIEKHGDADGLLIAEYCRRKYKC